MRLQPGVVRVVLLSVFQTNQSLKTAVVRLDNVNIRKVRVGVDLYIWKWKQDKSDTRYYIWQGDWRHAVVCLRQAVTFGDTSSGIHQNTSGL